MFKLTHKGTVTEYLSQFEALANRVIGLLTPFLLGCFVYGLTPYIRWEVQALQPLNLIQAASLAKLQQDKFIEQRHVRSLFPFLASQPPSISLTPTHSPPPTFVLASP